MTDLRKAAEDILETLDKPFTASKTIFQAKEALRQALAQSDDFVYNEDKSYRLSPSTGSFGIGDTPPKREWVGLSDEDKDELLNLDNWTDIVEAVEAKLKEKNT